MSTELTKARADAVAATFGLSLAQAPVCLACLFMVACELESGNGPRITGSLRSLTPTLWDEGLSAPALAAARRASERGVPDAAEAVADLERAGGRCRVARALVLLLAEELNRDARADAARWAAIGRRPEGVVPELN